MWIRAASMVLLGFALGQTAWAQDTGFEFRYHTYAQSTALLQELAEAHPALAKLYSIGKSASGTKEIWCIEIGNQATGEAAQKPAIYFDGNQHASEVPGGR